VTAIYRFGRIELNPATRQLLVDKQPALLGARALDVLLALIESRDRLVTKSELLDLVWPGLVVEENNLQVQISTLRKLLGQDAIATVAGRGYRFVLEPTDASGTQSPPRPQVPKHNLPEQVASFIGRERELGELRQLLARSRLVTLVGVGGVGKTQLGLRAASNVVEAFPDGVWFVELAPISDAALLPNAMTHALGVSAGSRRSHEDALQEFLRARQLLLLIDNCEHLIEACARLTHQLLVQCPQVKVLATSREAMGVLGEVTFAVQPLAVPDPTSFGLNPASPQTASENESVRLFIDRARSARPDFTISTANVAAIAEICFRLDGIPLAIELAAARAKALGPQEILSRLDDRFRLLTGGGRTVLPRQQTLRATIDWSYDLLTEPERTLFRRLSVFAGGCTLAATEVVGGAGDIAAASVLDLLSHLVDKSLVIAREGGGESRYHLLETVRQYGDARLHEVNEAGAVRDVHLGHFLQFAKTAEPHLRDAGQREWLGRLHAERDNLRAALDWACSAGHTQSGLDLAGVLGRYWHLRSEYNEGRYWLQRVQQLPDAADFPDEYAWALYFEGVLATFQSDTETIRRSLTRSLEVARGSANRRCIAYALDFLGHCEAVEADFELAEARLDESLSIFGEIGDRWGTAFNLWHAGLIRNARNDDTGALALWEQSLTLFQQLGDEHRVGILLRAVGAHLVNKGEFQRGTDMLRQALRIASERSARLEIAIDLWSFAEAVERDGDAASALELSHAAVAVFDAIGSLRSGIFKLLGIETARDWFGRHQAQYERAVADKRVLSMERAIDFALGYQFGSDTVPRIE
jgi:predicted ATPase/DNA-binding winged helix-turn-helix (wHTH) protein